MMTKQPLLMLPGWSMPSNVWGELSHRLSAHFTLQPIEWGMVQSADGFYQTASIILEAHPNQRFTLLGWSLGSLVALSLAAAYPAQIDRLILFSATSRFTNDRGTGYAAGWPARILEKTKAHLPENRENILRDFSVSMFSDLESADANRFQETFGEQQLAQPLPCLVAGQDYLLQNDCRAALSSIQTPLLLIHGEDDKICPIAASEYIRSQVAGNARLVTLPQTGHAPFFTQPETCWEAIQAFMESGR